MPVSGTVLGLGCGQPHGSAEILLKAALRAAEAEGAQVELVRLDELRLPSGAAEGAEPDDAWWLWERLVGCDGLIVSTPIISRTVAARLKLFGDRLLGPNADAAIIEGLTALRREGRGACRPVPRGRAGAQIPGGRLPRGGRLADLAVEDAGAADHAHHHVLDAHRRRRPGAVRGAGTPRSVLLDQAAIDRAALLGRNVASQLGVAFEAARYLGPPGLCPMCHLDVVVLRGADVECATCGARGLLAPDLTVTWTDLSASVISMDEKRAHAAEIQQTASRHAALRAEIEDRAREFDAYDPTIRPERAASP